MDSPILIADFHLRERMIDGQNIRMALHTPATEQVQTTILKKHQDCEQKAVFGELPKFDFESTRSFPTTCLMQAVMAWSIEFNLCSKQQAIR